jgi:pilus assembly protein Flp/PilA
MLTTIRSWFKNEEGATAVEYGIMVALIAVAIIVTVGLLGQSLDKTFTKVNTEVSKTN